MRAKWFIISFVLLVTTLDSMAQYDSTYIYTFPNYLVGRFLFNRKYSGLNVSNDQGNYNVRYRPNKTLSVGLGASYKFITLNISTGLIQPNEKKGQTSNIDFQLHKYGRRFVTDAIFQIYKGFYIPDGRYAGTPGEFYIRPDLALNLFGVSHQYIFNNKKFSYRAVYQQTEIQRKSAGSFLGGIEVFAGRVKGDSAIVPRHLESEQGETLYKMRFLKIGPSAGYTYTWVHHKFFLNVSGSVSLNLSINSYYEEYIETTYSAISPSSMLRLCAGYNAGKWGVNFVFNSTDMRLPDFGNRSIFFSAGNIRMNYVYRFEPGKKTKHLLRGIDKVDKRFKR